MTNFWLWYIMQQLWTSAQCTQTPPQRGHRQEGFLLKMLRTSSYILHSISGIMIISQCYLFPVMANNMITAAQRGLGPALIR